MKTKKPLLQPISFRDALELRKITSALGKTPAMLSNKFKTLWHKLRLLTFVLQFMVPISK